jgi:hypothetical protein
MPIRRKKRWSRRRPKCKTEKFLLQWLKTNMSDVEITYQPKYDWCRNVGKTECYFPFDYAIEQYKLIIELDGRQHYFKARRNWNPDAAQDRDVYKMKCAISHGYTVIRLVQEDVWADRNDWQERFIWHLRPHNIPRAILIDSDTKAEFDPLRDKLQIARISGTNA